jgi:hypothetical protein
MRVALAVGLAMAALAALVLAVGQWRWRAGTQALQAALHAARVPITPGHYHADELQALPAPVQRYFRTVLVDGQAMVATSRFEQSGSMNMSETGESWKPFTATQNVVTRRPGFDWDARVAVLPGVAVHVHDAYAAGSGRLLAAVFGLIPLADQHDSPAIAEGELLRFLAEAVLYPTALLPSQGVRWEAVDATSSRASLRDGTTNATVSFHFGADGLIDSLQADARGRTVAGVATPTPWAGRWRSYEVRDGMRVPLEGEVAWVLPDGSKPYWRGRIGRLSYTFAAAP